MWEKVAKRSHRPLQVYAFGAGADDVMLHGDVDFVLKDDRKVSMSWGAKAHFAKEDGELKMDVYQVFLVRLTSTSLALCYCRSLTDVNSGHGCYGAGKVDSTDRRSNFTSCTK